MTNEDDEDGEDERMERASRIREMRQGRRPGDDEETSETAEKSAVAAETDDGESADTEADDGSETDAGTAADSGFEFDDGSTPAIDETVAEGEPTGDGDADGTGTEQVEVAQAATAGVAESVGTTEAAAVDALAGSTFPIPDQASTIAEDDDQSLLKGDDQGVPTTAQGSVTTSHVGAGTRVLEFRLGEELFCLDIEYVEEIVELDTVTRVPNSPPRVLGVVDLRGQVTAIIDPTETLSVESNADDQLLVVFDADELGEQGHIGWAVDDVRQVRPVADEDVEHSPTDADHVEGVVNRDDEEGFVVWTTPELGFEDC
jgi:purine-binding chemotaxis protein CheW